MLRKQHATSDLRPRTYNAKMAAASDSALLTELQTSSIFNVVVPKNAYARNRRRRCADAPWSASRRALVRLLVTTVFYQIVFLNILARDFDPVVVGDWPGF